MKTNSLAMFLGLHVGDSLGATVEFSPAREKDNFHTEILGEGPFNLLPGDLFFLASKIPPPKTTM